MKKLIILCCFFPALSLAASDEAEAIRSAVKGNLKDVKACYESSLKQKPENEGKIVVDWVVSDTGEVTKAVINEAKTTLNDTTVHLCITDKIKTWKFPAAPKGQLVTVSYPFVFTN